MKRLNLCPPSRSPPPVFFSLPPPAGALASFTCCARNLDKADGQRTAPESRGASHSFVPSAVLAKAGGFDRERERGKASASECARLRAAACGEPAARDTAADDRIPHVVRRARLFSANAKGVDATSRAGTMSKQVSVCSAGARCVARLPPRTFATKHSETEKRPPSTPKFLPHVRLRAAISRPAIRSCCLRGRSAYAGFEVSNA